MTSVSISDVVSVFYFFGFYCIASIKEQLGYYEQKKNHI